MTEITSLPVAGWYLDPMEPNGSMMRFWSGSVWTSDTQPRLQPPSGDPYVDLKDQPNIDSGVPSLPESAVKKGFFGGKKELELENDELRRIISEMSIDKRDLLRQEIQQLMARKDSLVSGIKNLEIALVVAEEAHLMQEVGVYHYEHPLDNSVEYKEVADQLKDQAKMLVKEKNAVTSISSWTVNGSAVEGKKMVNEVSKLMLRAYVAEADNCIRSLKPSNREAMVERLNKTKKTIAKLGQSMRIEISDEFHALKIKEIRATSDFLKKKEEEREKEREIRASLREEEKVAKEIAAQREKMEKEKQKILSALSKMQGNSSGGLDEGHAAGIAELEATLAEVESGLAGLVEREANVKAGHVYVISNSGSFGPRTVKIGMTRRLDPIDRVKELSDASVPFQYGIHALFYSKDAQGLEVALHRRFDDRRVNLVNRRREFFFVSPSEVRDALIELDGHVLEFNETPDDEEYRQSEAARLQSLPPATI